TITSSTYGSATFTYNRFDNYVQPEAGDVYIVWGKLSLLDTANETFYDSSTGTLYLWTPNGDDPSNHTIEAKHRQHAFDLSGRSAITIENLSIIGADVITDNNSTGNILNNIQASYLTNALNITGSPWSFRQGDSGIVFNGSNNTLTNSTIAFSSANGVTLNGSNHTVSNNFIHDTDYAGTDSATITTGYIGSSGASSGHLIQYNTLYNSARSILLHRNSGNLQILHNDMFSAGLQVKDLGITYTYGSDGQGTVIAYNRVHDNYSSGYRSGIYLDNGSQNYIVHHNVVWNSGNALTLNTPSINNKVYNNTLVGQDNSVRASPAYGDMTGTELKNNILTSTLDGISSSVAQENNLYQGTDPLFTNPGNNDYTLQSGSPAIDAGQVISPYTDGYVGNAPDEGAYEYGAGQWYAGA
ncbi:MAG TPA: right-handed parallel beta-helix repeat-containing protein, partial [Ktedonobacteraceae bacterium]|nr:right-handed parallel beta-helix repeat-containing protein [Ktedonobacteraceae bacterium]